MGICYLSEKPVLLCVKRERKKEREREKKKSLIKYVLSPSFYYSNASSASTLPIHCKISNTSRTDSSQLPSFLNYILRPLLPLSLFSSSAPWEGDAHEGEIA